MVVMVGAYMAMVASSKKRVTKPYRAKRGIVSHGTRQRHVRRAQEWGEIAAVIKAGPVHLVMWSIGEGGKVDRKEKTFP